MRNILIAAMLSIALAACAGGPPLHDYDHAAITVVPVNNKQAHLINVSVQLNPQKERLALVYPTGSQLIIFGYRMERADWVVRIDQYRDIYSKTLLKVLSDKGKQCSITTNDPFSNRFAIEFGYQCDGDKS